MIAFTPLVALPKVSARTDAVPARVRMQPAFAIDIVDTPEALGRLAKQWHALEAVAEGPLLFQSVAWARAVFAAEVARCGSQFRPAIVTMREGDRLVAVLPLQLVKAQGRRVLVPLGDGYAQYAGLMADPAADCTSAVTRMLDAAIAATRCDVVMLRKVRADSQLAAVLPRGAYAVGEAMGAPFAALDAWPDFDSYCKAIKPKTRKLLRNARNRLERTAELAHAEAQTADQKSGVVERTLKGRAARLKSQGLTSRAFGDAGFHAFCHLLAEGRPGFPEIAALSFIHGGKPIAEQWGFVHRGRYYAYVASRDFDRSDISPGKLHLKEVMQTAYARGWHTVDLLAPAMPYKLVWARNVAEVRDWAMPVTLYGRVMTRIFDAWLRPMAKKLVLRLPPRLRSLLTSVRV